MVISHLDANYLSIFQTGLTGKENCRLHLKSYIRLKFWDPLRQLMGYAVAQLGETLRYKPEGRWFDWGLWDFSLT